MAKSKTRKPFTGYASDKDARKPRSVEGQGPSQPVKTAVRVDTGSSAQAHSVANTASHEAGRRRTPSGKFLIPVAVGTIGGGAYLAHRHKQRQTVTKSLIEPISGREVLTKSISPLYGARNAYTGPASSVGALVPTGKHVGHANDLGHFTPTGGSRRTPSGLAAQNLLRVTKRGDQAFRSFSAGRTNAKQGTHELNSRTLRYQAGEASTDNRKVGAAAGALFATGSGAAAVKQRRSSGEGGVGKSVDFVPRLGTSDVDRISTYAHQVGSRGRRIA